MANEGMLVQIGDKVMAVDFVHQWVNVLREGPSGKVPIFSATFKEKKEKKAIRKQLRTHAPELIPHLPKQIA